MGAVSSNDSALLIESAKLSRPSVSQQLPNLCVNRNFCIQIQNYLTKTDGKTERCVGQLERTSNCKHIIYLSPPIANDHRTQAISLAQLISSIGQKPTEESLPQNERLRLGKQLALSVLKFHSTPWLNDAWRSKDVLFFGVEEDDLVKRALASPHFNARVADCRFKQERQACANRSLAPNPLLFGLGVVLLELAFQAPLQSLQKPADLANGEGPHFTEFFCARRLSKTIGSSMGSSYGKIVRKCLNCDFGEGDDLSAPRLQSAFYEQIICELERLETGFRKLTIGG
jgi:hypothetical protein